MKNRHKYRVICAIVKKTDIVLIFYCKIRLQSPSPYISYLPSAYNRIALLIKCRDMATRDIRFCSVKKRYNSVYTLTAVHWRGGEAPNVTLIPFKWHLWSRDIILIYPLNPPFAALFAAITHTFFIICIVFCVNYVDLRSSQGNFSLWK